MTAEADGLITLDEVASAGRTALYRLYNAADEVIYIGISDDPVGRMGQHAKEQPWWPEVARKTVVWYQYREQADKAETIAIGMEQPKYNKAKRYVRLPEQPFPGLVSKRTARMVKRMAPLAEPEPDPEADTTEVDDQVPDGWPPDMWCRAWWPEGVARFTGDPSHVEMYLNSIWGKKDPIAMLATKMSSRYDGCEGRGPYLGGETAWIQDDASGSPLAGLWHGHSVSAHCDAWTPYIGDFPAAVAGVQDKFLGALLESGRCSLVRGGWRALAAGFGTELEAQIVAYLLQQLASGRIGGFDRYTAAILKQGPGDVIYTCPDCGTERSVIAGECPLCPECKWPMRHPTDTDLDRWLVQRERSACGSDDGFHHPARRSHAPLTRKLASRIDEWDDRPPMGTPPWRQRFPLFAPPPGEGSRP